MRICHQWIQKKTMDQWGRSPPSRCTTAHDDKWIVCMEVMACAVTSCTIAQQIQSVTYHLVSTRTNRHRLQKSEMSARRPLLRLLLNGNHRFLRRQ
ncbi:transposable element Tcb1 transposase [Trichonephila clavipes]|nr:transposable element Tcb1 transposase [Trichonephila clavipes]